VIKDEDAERAVAYLRDSAEEAAQARANVAYLEAFLKVVKAEEMAKCANQPVSAQERDALCSVKYRTALEGYKVAVELDNVFRFKREAATARLSAWQTLSANYRGMGK
jgi:hypothetical protein